MGDYGSTVVGIDLGTTYSRVAVWRNNCVTVIPNENGNLHTPSCVAFTDTGILIGDAAKDHASEYPTNTISNIKRVLEISFSDPSMQSGTKHWQFKVVGGDLKNKPKIVVNGNGKEEKLEPEEVVSLLFAQLKENAENYLGCKVKNAVVTVPASFNNSQREAMKEATYMAGLSVVLLEEPIATLLAYGLEKEDEDNLGERNMLVFDFGGGSLDVSVVSTQGGDMKVKAIIEDTDLGGEYFDDNLAKYCQLELMVDADQNAEVLGRLRAVAERAKFILSSGDQSSAQTSSLVDEVGWEDSFTLVMLERMNQYQFQPCIDLVVQCLKDACVKKSQIDDVIIVGGLSNIPRVQELLQSFFEGKELCKSIQLDEVMVHGAAIQAAMLSEEHFEKNIEETETTTETFDDVDDNSSHSVLEWENSDGHTHTSIIPPQWDSNPCTLKEMLVPQPLRYDSVGMRS
ncbi:hypothetical protein LUZ63_007418 [Rhynchospora breviuscula]|uniref:Heat shock protein 70 n=1 Tax=Rhynchospora breviuscula TaxID=2022672 RepID=A0A9Q0HUJ0_9POAL|nr:hypothetical protein LUZ63_007418 [Rhynchospora breviuscula]